jgi:alkanesulfonate monooxygenase SsuD/methylene tetrahydromethanopterin reductase-like flavin-dependent oxidoreductase (luciferase family)
VLLAQIAGATQNVRLGPAVVLLPVHHPLLVAEDWATLDLLSGGRVDFAAGRGYDAKEFAPFGAPFNDSLPIFEEGLEVLWRAWTEQGRFSHHGQYYHFDDLEVRPKPLQQPLRPYVASFSRASLDLAAKHDWNIMFAPFAATMVYGGLAEAVTAFAEECAKYDRTPRRTISSYFIHIGEGPAETYGREALLRYFHGILPSLPDDPATAPPSLRYFIDIVARLRAAEAPKLGSSQILLGSPQRIIEDLKRVEAAGVSEVILYFNYGGKPAELVKEQMYEFQESIAPMFRNLAIA